MPAGTSPAGASPLALLHAYTVIGAAAHEINDELTIICSALAIEIEKLPEEEQTLLREAQGALIRCGTRCQMLLKYAAQKKIPVAARPLEGLL